MLYNTFWKRLSQTRGEGDCAHRERAQFLRFKMTSVDSGVETGNDSNDSSSVQHENQQQHVQVTSSSMNPVNNEELRLEFDNPIPRLCFDNLDSKGYFGLLKTNENNILLQCITNRWRTDESSTDSNQQRTRMLQDSARKSLISKMKSKVNNRL